MFQGKTFLAIIPARGGSKGIPRKNIFEVKGRPLIAYTIEEAKKSAYLDRIIVSTDDYEIAEVARKYGAETPFLRPKELADDQSNTIDALIHAISYLKNSGSTYDYLVLLQPTQPLRKSWHIDQAIQKIVDNNAEGLVSVSEVKEHPILIRSIDEYGNLKNLLDTTSTVRRQDFPAFYKVNGAIYINKLNDNFNNNISLNDNKLAYIMEGQYDLDIDEPLDLEIMELMVDRYLDTVNKGAK